MSIFDSYDPYLVNRYFLAGENVELEYCGEGIRIHAAMPTGGGGGYDGFFKVSMAQGVPGRVTIGKGLVVFGRYMSETVDSEVAISGSDRSFIYLLTTFNNALQIQFGCSGRLPANSDEEDYHLLATIVDGVLTQQHFGVYTIAGRLV